MHVKKYVRLQCEILYLAHVFHSFLRYYDEIPEIEKLHSMVTAIDANLSSMCESWFFILLKLNHIMQDLQM